MSRRGEDRIYEAAAGAGAAAGVSLFFFGVAAFLAGVAAAAFLVPAAFFAAAGLLLADALVLVTRPDLVLPSTFFSSTTAGAAPGLEEPSGTFFVVVRLAPVFDFGFAVLVPAAAFLVVAGLAAAALGLVVLGLAAPAAPAAFLGAAVPAAAFFVVVVVAALVFLAAGFFSPAGLAVSFLASLMGPEVPEGVDVSWRSKGFHQGG